MNCYSLFKIKSQKLMKKSKTKEIVFQTLKLNSSRINRKFKPYSIQSYQQSDFNKLLGN
jgi:hypothetical protein